MLLSFDQIEHRNQHVVDEDVMSRREIQIAPRCMIVDRTARYPDRHDAIVPSPAFCCEFTVADPLNGLRTGSRLNFELSLSRLPKLPGTNARLNRRIFGVAGLTVDNRSPEIVARTRAAPETAVRSVDVGLFPVS